MKNYFRLSLYLIAFLLLSSSSNPNFFQCLWHKLTNQQPANQARPLAPVDQVKPVDKETILIPGRKGLLDRTFEQAYCQTRVYQSYWCGSNVVRLFRAFQKDYPEAKADQFKVLYITPKQRIEDVYTKHMFYVRNARSGEHVDWRYHVVLEYQGRIYDLDYTINPTPIDRFEYLDFFMSKEAIDASNSQYQVGKEDLIVFAVPGEHYAMGDAEFASSFKFQALIMKKFKGIPLVQYLSDKKL